MIEMGASAIERMPGVEWHEVTADPGESVQGDDGLFPRDQRQPERRIAAVRSPSPRALACVIVRSLIECLPCDLAVGQDEGRSLGPIPRLPRKVVYIGVAAHVGRARII